MVVEYAFKYSTDFPNSFDIVDTAPAFSTAEHSRDDDKVRKKPYASRQQRQLGVAMEGSETTSEADGQKLDRSDDENATAGDATATGGGGSSGGGGGTDARERKRLQKLLYPRCSRTAATAWCICYMACRWFHLC
jgi:hypothetical protein